MTERKNITKMKGNPVTLVGTELKVSDTAPDAQLVANDLSAVALSSFKDKVLIICSVPSLDTAVCDTMTRKFNEAAASLSDDIVVITVSMDLPFAQKRWCGAAGIENVITLSDYKYAYFGQNFGVLIKEFKLLARAVFVIDKTGTIKYIQIVPEIASEPNYDAALKAARNLVESSD